MELVWIFRYRHGAKNVICNCCEGKVHTDTDSNKANLCTTSNEYGDDSEIVSGPHVSMLATTSSYKAKTNM